MTPTTFTPTAMAALESLRADLGTDDLADLRARAQWSHLAEPGDADAGRLIARLGAADALEAVISGDAGTAAGRDALARWSPRLRADDLEVALGRAARAGVRLLVPSDPAWPPGLDDLDVHAPLCLWVRGAVDALRAPSVALVGARAATAYGEHVTRDLASALAGDGLVIVSGAAYGIDGAAHRAALGADGRTVAFLAGGVERAYPAGHVRLLDEIVAHGAVASEVPCGAAPTKWRFLQRNRLIAALSRATVVVEAGWRSGSINTASHAASLGRELGAVPGPVTSAASAGTHRLLREYGAVCVTGADDVREMLGLTGTAALFSQGDRSATDDATRVLDALSTRSRLQPADISRRSGLEPGRVQALLGLLLLDGRAARDERGWWRPSAAG